MNKPKRITKALLLLLTVTLKVNISFSEPTKIDANLKSEIQTLREQLTNDSVTEIETKNHELELLKRADEQLVQSVQRSEQLNSYIETANNINKLINEIEDLSQKTEKSTLPKDLSNEQAQAKLEVLSAEQRSLRKNIEEIQLRQTSLLSRTSAIAEELAAAKIELSKFKEETNIETDNFIGLSANKLYLHASYLNLKSLISDLESELSTVPARQQVNSARFKLTESQLLKTSEQIELLQLKLADSRQTFAESAITKSKNTLIELTDLGPVITSLAQENIDLATQLRPLANQADEVILSIVKLQSDLKQLDQSRDTVERVLATGLITDELVDVLREMRNTLPKTEPLRQLQTKNKNTQTIQQLNVILWQNRLRGLQESTDAVKQLWITKNIGLKETTTQELEAVSRIVKERIEILENLLDVTNNQSERLVTQAIAVSASLNGIQGLFNLLDRKLIWLPSRTGFDGHFFENMMLSVLWLTNKGNWSILLADFKAGFLSQPFLSLIFLLLPFLILSFRGLLKNILLVLSKKVGNVKLDTFSTTPIAIFVTFILAIPKPLFLATIAGVISLNPHINVFSVSIAKGLATMSSVLFILALFQSMCRPKGLFATHFNWSAIARDQLNRTFNWFIWVICVSTFFFVSAFTSGLSELRYGLALLSFIVSGVAIGMFTFQFLKPKDGIAMAIIEDRPKLPFIVLIWPLLVIVPVSIGLLPLIGFFDTAIELQSRVFQSGITLFSIAVTYGLFLRLYRIAHRRYRLRKLLIQRAKMENQRQSSQDVLESGDAIPSLNSIKNVDIDNINIQIRRIFYFLAGLILFIGLWIIWSPLMPALGIIDEIVLWESTKQIGLTEVNRPITLWNLIVSLLWIIGGFIAARNIRGLLEIGIFEKLKLNNGERYASLTIIGYVLIGLGLVLGLAQLGINWSKLQWIIAALGVGLGFGLQEIVANFISGIIILFERPIRVGDTVTIGNLSGTVRNIKIRATTITDFDNLDVLLPNKSIITENVTNWTLNDAVTRLVLPIGVAYGSDIEKVRSLLMDVVTHDPDVLEVPPPTVFFIAHGDSSLDFHVRVFVENPIKRMPVTHEINAKINTVLKEHGIEIPFPQRTLHIIKESNSIVDINK